LQSALPQHYHSSLGLLESRSGSYWPLFGAPGSPLAPSLERLQESEACVSAERTFAYSATSQQQPYLEIYDGRLSHCSVRVAEHLGLTASLPDYAASTPFSWCQDCGLDPQLCFHEAQQVFGDHRFHSLLSVSVLDGCHLHGLVICSSSAIGHRASRDQHHQVCTG